MFNIKKSKILGFIGKLCCVIGISTIVCLCGMSASCKITPEGISILETDYSTPKLINIQIASNSEVFIEFDKEINLKQLEIVPIENQENKYFVDISDCGKNSSFYIDCKTNFSFLNNYQVFGVVEDDKYNTLTFSAVLPGYNDNLPKIAFSELRTYYQKPKLEFIELVAESDGNLAGMVLEIYYKNQPCEFIFPPVEVKKGDFVIVHGRTMDDTCINESDNLNEATYKDALPDILDFWLDSDSKVIGNSGVILLRNRKNGSVVESLLYTEPEKEDWGNTLIKEAAKEAVESGTWKGKDSIEDAAVNKKPSGTRSLSRDFSIVPSSEILLENVENQETNNKENIVLSKDMWIFVNTGNATMGSENSLVPYEE